VANTRYRSAVVKHVLSMMLASAATLGACTDAPPVIAPIVEFPTNDTASAFPLDSITVSVAHEGDELDLVSATFSRGEAIEVPNLPYGDDLVFHMTGRIGTSEVAYGRTCAFELRADGRIPTPHLWFSRLVKFGGMELRPLAREIGTALMYNDGSGLLLGGVNPNDPADAIEQVERFDPNTGEYETLHEIVPRLGSAIAPLGVVNDARVVVVGGLDPATGKGAEFVEVLDAASTTERQYENFFDPQMARVGLSATALSDGRVIVIGGRVPNGATSNSVDEVSVSSGIVNVRPTRAMLMHSRSGHTATRLSDNVGAGVLVTGGLDDAGKPVAEAELFKPLTEGFSATFNRTMVVPRYRHQAVPLPDGSVLILGGLTLDTNGVPTPVATIEVFTLDAGFVALNDATLPPNAGLLDFSATVLPDGRVLLAGGRLVDGGSPLGTAFIARLDPFDATIDIVATDRLGEPRAGHQATLLCDGTVLFAGGTSLQSTYERYNPPAVGRR
jgi:hypothetical protein